MRDKPPLTLCPLLASSLAPSGLSQTLWYLPLSPLLPGSPSTSISEACPVLAFTPWLSTWQSVALSVRPSFYPSIHVSVCPRVISGPFPTRPSRPTVAPPPTYATAGASLQACPASASPCTPLGPPQTQHLPCPFSPHVPAPPTSNRLPWPGHLPQEPPPAPTPRSRARAGDFLLAPWMPLPIQVPPGVSLVFLFITFPVSLPFYFLSRPTLSGFVLAWAESVCVSVPSCHVHLSFLSYPLPLIKKKNEA